MAFGNCRKLKSVKLNAEIEKLDDLCFSGTLIKRCKIPRKSGKALYELGIGDDNCRELVLPNGLELVDCEWFASSNLTKVTISATVKRLLKRAFVNSKHLRQIVFESGS